MIQRKVEVALGDRSYPVYVGTEVAPSFAPTCQQHGIPRRVGVITDTNVAPHYLKPLEESLRASEFTVSLIVLSPGEQQKSLSRTNFICTDLLKEGVGRKCALVALGGGVIGDLVGFVAAT